MGVINRAATVGLNLLYFRPDITGGGETYAKGLLSALGAIESEFKFLVFVREDAAEAVRGLCSVDNFEVVSLRCPPRASARHLWEQVQLRAVCRDHQIDLLHSLGNVCPLWLGSKQVVTIHDLLYLHVTGLSLSRRMFYSLMIPASARSCNAIIAVSRSTRDDLRSRLGISEDKLFHVSEGPGQNFIPGSNWGQVKERYKLPEQFFLSIGTGEHKRLDVSLSAVRNLRKQNVPAHLVVAGEDMESTRRMDEDDGLTWLGYIPKTDLAALYQRATAVICASEMEGFGLPILEAMSLGTPVISTDRGSLPEVGGKGSLYFNCGDSEALASAMLQVQSPEFRRGLVERGAGHVAGFSWKLCALRTVEVYRSVLRRDDDKRRDKR